MENISIVVYEDNESYRDFLCQILKFEPGFELKGAFSNCLKCVEQIGNLMPDIVLMDLKMPNDGDGIEGLKKLNAAYPGICVIMLTDSVKQQDIFNAIQAQPSGYINKKKVGPAQIIESIRTVYQNKGSLAFSPDIIRTMTDFIQRGVPQNTDTYGLTPAELKVLELLAQGLSEKLIADKLSVVADTAHRHKVNIYRKLGVHSETEAVQFAFDHRLLPPDMLRHKS